jgi:hypothetical protein
VTGGDIAGRADGIWTFLGCKQHNLFRALTINPTMGDQYLYVAFDQDTKLIATYAVGKRSKEVTQAFMYDLADRIVTGDLSRPRQIFCASMD